MRFEAIGAVPYKPRYVYLRVLNRRYVTLLMIESVAVDALDESVSSSYVHFLAYYTSEIVLQQFQRQVVSRLQNIGRRIASGRILRRAALAGFTGVLRRRARTLALLAAAAAVVAQNGLFDGVLKTHKKITIEYQNLTTKYRRQSPFCEARCRAFWRVRTSVLSPRQAECEAGQPSPCWMSAAASNLERTADPAPVATSSTDKI